MGTKVKIEAFKGENTTKEQWCKLKDYFVSEFGADCLDDDFLDSGTINCPWSMAGLRILINEDIIEYLKGSEITFSLYYLEAEPDESLTLWRI